MYKSLEKYSKEIISEMFGCYINYKFNVALLLSYNKETGEIGINLGAHPNVNIAIERALTESRQGKNLSMFSNQIFLKSNYEIANSDYSNIFQVGEGTISISSLSLFSSDYLELKTYDDENSNYAKFSLETLKKISNNVYVRNCSNLGFPALQIVVPEYCELEEVDIKFEKNYAIVKKFLENNYAYDKNDVTKLISAILDCLQYVNLQNIKKFIEVNVDFPFEYIGMDLYFLLALLLIDNEFFPEASMILEKINSCNKIKKDDLIFNQYLLLYIKSIQENKNNNNNNYLNKYIQNVIGINLKISVLDQIMSPIDIDYSLSCIDFTRMKDIE